MSLGDIEKRFVKTCSKGILSCDTLVLNLKNHKDALRVRARLVQKRLRQNLPAALPTNDEFANIQVETKAIDEIRTLYMDALTNRYM